jgi:hypothetical protein
MEMNCDSRLLSLYQRAIKHYREHEGNRWVVPDSIPIVYFGNLQSYLDSRTRIVTVGLNPSGVEFDEDRFGPEVKTSLRPDTLERALCNYFRDNPYTDWFDRAFETILQPLGASYYEKIYPGPAPRRWTWKPQPNVALHTDIYSPLATAPTWSGLPKAAARVKEELGAWGFPFWKDLIAALKPDIVLMSVGRPCLSKLGALRWRGFSPLGAATKPRQEMQIARFGDTHIVWGEANVRPFLYLSYEQRPAAAQTILAQPELESLRPINVVG